MKAKLLWIIPFATLLSSCDKKEEPVAAKQKTKSFRPSATASAEAEKHLESSAPETPAVAGLEAGSIAATPSSSPVAPLAVAPESAGPGAPAAQGPLTQEQRDAYRAEQRAKRAAEIARQMTQRLKERDADGDGMLAQSEVPERMQRGFTRADTNGDGSLDAAEQETLIQSMSDRMSEGGQRDRGGFAGRGRRQRGGRN